jgi:aspartate 1-decarboxylase
MTIFLLKSKLHRAKVTDSNTNYEGSLTVSIDLMEAVGFVPYEKVLVSNLANGERFETYLITGKRGAGEICLNGPAALLGKVGDVLTIMSFTEVDEAQASQHEPQKATLQDGNRLPS